MVECTYIPVGTCHVPVPSTIGVGHTCHVPAAPCDTVGTSDHMLPMSQHCDMVARTYMFTNKQILASLHGGICVLSHTYTITKHHQWHHMPCPCAIKCCIGHTCCNTCHATVLHFIMDSSVYTNSLSQCNHVAANVHARLHTSSVLTLPFGSMGMYVLR